MDNLSFVEKSLTERKRYQASGAINVVQFVFWTALALAVAMALASLMFGLILVGHYYAIIVPCVAAFAVAGMALLAVSKGHCRNPLVALLTSLLLGVVLYLGSFYIGMIYHMGADAAARPELFVKYIRLRLLTDVERDTSMPDDTSKPRHGSYGMNMFRFGLEFLLVIAIVGAVPYRRARKPYCEICHRWLARESTVFEPDRAAEIIDSLQKGSTRALAAICAAPSYTTIPNTTMAVEYCPSLKEGTTRDCPAYISLKSVIASPKGAALDTFEQSKGKMVARCVQLNPDEFPALAPRFSVLEAYAGRAAVAALLPQVEPESEAKEAPPDAAFVEVSPLSSDHSGKVLTRKAIWLGNIAGFAVIGGFIGGLALLAWGASVLEQDGSGRLPRSVGVALCVVGGLGTLFALVGILVDPGFGANRRLRNAFKAELSRRSGKFVEPDDPDAIFVEIVPKLNWGKMMLENASDIGLLLVDPRRKEIRFEGDKERWRVPAAGILSHEIEFQVQGHGAGATKIYYVVLRAARPGAFWEAPLRQRTIIGALTAQRKKRAKKLHSLIAAISV